MLRLNCKGLNSLRRMLKEHTNIVCDSYDVRGFADELNQNSKCIAISAFWSKSGVPFLIPFGDDELEEGGTA